jgi:hypothetical protein
MLTSVLGTSHFLIRALGLKQSMIVQIAFAILKKTAPFPLSIRALDLLQPIIFTISFVIFSIYLPVGFSKLILCHLTLDPTRSVIFRAGV